MRLHSTLVAGLLLALTLAGCQATAEPQTVQFLDGQYEILKPSSWRLMNDLNDAADLQMGNAAKEAYGMVLTEPRVDFDEELTEQGYSDLTRGMLTQSLSNLKETGPKAMTVNGQPAVLYDLQGSIDDIRIRYWHISIASPEHFHQVVLWSLPSRFEAHQKDFEAVLHSLRTASSPAAP
jgi:hypothetical protein